MLDHVTAGARMSGDLPKRGSFAHLLHSLSHLHLLPRRGSRTSLHSDERQEGAGAGAGAGAAASGEHDEQREPVRARRFDAQHHHGARHAGGAKELRKSKSHQEFGTILKTSTSTPDLDAGISISEHAASASPAGETVSKALPADVEPERSAGPSFSLGGAQLSPRAQPATTDASDTGCEMRNLNVTAQVETAPADERAAKFEDTPQQSSIRRRQAPQ